MAKSKEPIRRAREIFDEFLSKADPEAVAENHRQIELPSRKRPGGRAD